MIKFTHKGIEYSCETGEDFAAARRVLGLDGLSPPPAAPAPAKAVQLSPTSAGSKVDPQLHKFAEFVESHTGKIVKSHDFLSYLEFKGSAGLGPYLRSIKTRLKQFDPPMDLDLILLRQSSVSPAVWLIPSSREVRELISRIKP